MDDKQNVGGSDRLVRAALTVLLSVLALRWLKAGKRGRGLLAGIGALGFGFNATTGYCGANDALDVDTTAGGPEPETTFVGETPSSDSDVVGSDPTGDADAGASDHSEESDDEASGEADDEASEESTTDSGLTCAFCGEAIVTGQARGPNEQGQIVHDECA